MKMVSSPSSMRQRAIEMTAVIIAIIMTTGDISSASSSSSKFCSHKNKYVAAECSFAATATVELCQRQPMTSVCAKLRQQAVDHAR